MKLSLAALLTLIAVPAVAEDRIEERYGNWTLHRDGRSSLYCWLESSAVFHELPPGRIAQHNGRLYPRIFAGFGVNGGPFGYGGTIGHRLEGQGLIWLVTERYNSFVQLNGTIHGDFFGRRPPGEIMEAIGEAEYVFLISEEPGPDGSFDLDALDWWVAFSTEGFAEANAVILELCGGPQGWDGPRSAG